MVKVHVYAYPWVEACKLASIDKNGIALGQLVTVDVKHRDLL
jgi:hypothetical protein